MRFIQILGLVQLLTVIIWMMFDTEIGIREAVPVSMCSMVVGYVMVCRERGTEKIKVR